MTPTTMNLLLAKQATAQSCPTCAISFLVDNPVYHLSMTVSWNNSCGSNGDITVIAGQIFGPYNIPSGTLVTIDLGWASETITIGFEVACGDTYIIPTS